MASIFTDEELLEVFPNRSNPISTKVLWENLGSPVGKRQLLDVAKRDLPPAYSNQEEAQACGAVPGARSSVLLAKAAIAVFANRRGLKPGSKLDKLENDFRHRLPEFFELCKIGRPN